MMKMRGYNNASICRWDLAPRRRRRTWTGLDWTGMCAIQSLIDQGLILDRAARLRKDGRHT